MAIGGCARTPPDRSSEVASGRVGVTFPRRLPAGVGILLASPVAGGERWVSSVAHKLAFLVFPLALLQIVGYPPQNLLPPPLLIQLLLPLMLPAARLALLLEMFL